MCSFSGFCRGSRRDDEHVPDYWPRRSMFACFAIAIFGMFGMLLFLVLSTHMGWFANMPFCHF